MDTGIVFITGGSALNPLARRFVQSNLSTSHLLTVFDDGGSSGRLRQAFDIVAVGDLRNRLTALSSSESKSCRAVVKLFETRLEKSSSQPLLRMYLHRLRSEKEHLLRDIDPETRGEIVDSLDTLLLRAPRNFDWSDGSLGNFILVGRYLLQRDWETVFLWAHRILSTCGLALPITTGKADLSARLKNGRFILGESALTDEHHPLESGIDELMLHPPADRQTGEGHRVAVAPWASAELKNARAIVYSWGSFYTSIISALLVDGAAAAIAERPVPKVLMLNPTRDVETKDLQPRDMVDIFRTYFQRAQGRAQGTAITHVLALRAAVKTSSWLYHRDCRPALERVGIRVIEVDCSGLPQERELAAVTNHLVRLAVD